MSVALPAPDPRILVGVFTAIMTISDSRMQLATFAEKNKFGALKVETADDSDLVC